MFEPDRREQKLQYPDSKHDENLLPSFDLTKQAKSVPIENKRTDQGLGQIISKRHSSRSSQPSCQSAERFQRPLDDDSNICHDYEQAAQIIILTAEKH